MKPEKEKEISREGNRSKLIACEGFSNERFFLS